MIYKEIKGFFDIPNKISYLDGIMNGKFVIIYILGSDKLVTDGSI